MAVYRTYTNDIHRELDLFAAWEPNDAVALGDYGQMEGKKFNRLANISRFGVRFATHKQPVGADSLDYTSSSGVSINTDISGSAAGGTAQGKIVFKFSKSDTIVLQHECIEREEITDLVSLGDRIEDIYKRKGDDWKLSYVIVTSLVRSRGVLALISESSSASVTLSGKVPVSGVKLNVNDVSITSSSGQIAKYHSPNSIVTPLFQLHELKDPLIGGPKFVQYK